MAKYSPKISLCMIARNEERYIAEAIKSVQSIVSEIIVVDTGSSDRTKEIVRELGGRIIEDSWQNDFSRHRNISLDAAVGDWILVLDADERIDARDLVKLRKLTRDRNKCYRLTQRHYVNNSKMPAFVAAQGEYPQWEEGYAGYSPNLLCRFFPNKPSIRYRGCVHELVEYAIVEGGAGQLINLDIPIHHYGQSEDLVRFKNKNSFYLNICKIKTEEQPDSWQAWNEYGTAAMICGNFTESAKAFKKAMEWQRPYPKMYRSYGTVLTELGRVQEAIDIYNQGLVIDPNDPETHFALANAYLIQKRTQFCEAHLKKALKLNPKYVAASCLLGLLYSISGKATDAIGALKNALDLLPNSPDALYILGKTYRDIKLDEEANEVTQIMKELYPEYQMPRLFHWAYATKALNMH